MKIIKSGSEKENERMMKTQTDKNSTKQMPSVSYGSINMMIHEKADNTNAELHRGFTLAFPLSSLFLSHLF